MFDRVVTLRGKTGRLYDAAYISRLGKRKLSFLPLDRRRVSAPPLLFGKNNCKPLIWDKKPFLGVASGACLEVMFDFLNF